MTRPRRPAKPRQKPARDRIDLRAPAEDIARWRATAAQQGRTLSQQVRWLLEREEAKR